MNLHIQLKTAFISGSTQGIGYAIAEQLLAEGANVIINGRTEIKVQQAVNRLQQKFPQSSVQGIAADLSQAEQVNKLITQLPQIDILINNAGVFELKAFFNITDDEWLDIFHINVLSGVRLARALMPAMLERNWGRIIFISSEAGVNIPEQMIHYGMTKTALLSLNNGLAKLTKGSCVTVNTIVGGPTYSDGVSTTVNHLAQQQNQTVESIKQHLMQSLNSTSLIGRFIEPEEIAALAAHLCSPTAGAINGASLRVDGGVLTTIF
jgi:NAD(P)-dependent dehydrogenase (short-subunit alcohol dehydrogenase family)